LDKVEEEAEGVGADEAEVLRALSEPGKGRGPTRRKCEVRVSRIACASVSKNDKSKASVRSNGSKCNSNSASVGECNNASKRGK
jgi:hypothetical protein